MAGIIRPNAEADARDARLWSESQRTGLGDELLEEIRHAVPVLRRGEALSLEQVELLEGYVAMNEAMLAKADEAMKLPITFIVER